MNENLYKFANLQGNSLESRIKRVERVVQFPKRGINANTESKFRTVAASQVDKDGNIIVSGVVEKTKTTTKSVSTIAPPKTVTPPTEPPISYWPTPPYPPVIAIYLLAQPLVLTFSFNYQLGTATSPITEYRIYRNTTNDSTTATQIRTYVQPASGTGVQKVEDTVGANVTFYYWVSAFGNNQESAKTPAQTGAVTSLPATSVMTTYRPSAVTNGGGLNSNFSSPGSVYDNNLISSAINGTGSSQCIWRGFSAASGSPTSVVLKVVYDCGFDTGGSATIQHSINGGSSFTTDASLSTEAPKTTLSITLLNSQDLTQVQVKATSAVTGTILHIYESWIEVTT